MNDIDYDLVGRQAAEIDHLRASNHFLTALICQIKTGVVTLDRIELCKGGFLLRPDPAIIANGHEPVQVDA